MSYRRSIDPSPRAPSPTNPGLLGLLLALAGCPSSAGPVDDSSGTDVSSTADTTDATTGATAETSQEGSSTTEPDAGTTSTTAGTADDSGDSGSTSTGETGVVGVCGDGVKDPGEACDDGDRDELDGCLSTCELVGGTPLTPIALPPLLGGETLRCFTAVDKAQIDASAHVLAIGSTVDGAGPMGQMAAHVRAVPLPDGDPEQWSYLEHAGQYGRWPRRMLTAPDGDVIVAGLVWTEDVDLDSGGHLWVARFAPDGAPVWSREHADIHIRTERMALGPGGDIVLAGASASFTGLTSLQVLDPQGEPKWDDVEPKVANEQFIYHAAAFGEDGTIYAAATRSVDGSGHSSVRLRAFTPAGASLWETDAVSPFQPQVWAGGLVRTDADVLVFAGLQRDADGQPVAALALAAYSTDGDPLWWKEWTPAVPGFVSPWQMIAAPDAGVYLSGALTGDPNQQTFVGRFDAAGDNLWANIQPGGQGVDALLGPDDLLYVLTYDHINVHAP